MHRMITIHARPRQTHRQTDRQTDKHHDNSATIRSITNVSCAKNAIPSIGMVSYMELLIPALGYAPGLVFTGLEGI